MTDINKHSFDLSEKITPDGVQGLSWFKLENRKTALQTGVVQFERCACLPGMEGLTKRFS